MFSENELLTNLSKVLLFHAPLDGSINAYIHIP